MNEALRNALAAKGIDRLDIATKLQVDPKTVERWLAGRLPHSSSRAAIAKVLNMAESELWPAAKDPHARHFGPEIRAVYPHRSAVPRDVWHKLFAGHEIDILAYNGLFLLEDPATLELIAARADDGVQIRILLSDPEFPAAVHSSTDDSPSGYVAAHIRHAHDLLSRLVAHNGVECRFHRRIPYTSIYRAGDQLLASPHIYGLPASAAPVLRLRRHADAALFAAYVDSFDRSWSNLGD